MRNEGEKMDDNKYNEYENAAKKINEYIEKEEYNFEVSEVEMQQLYDEFRDKFSPAILSKIKDDELLKKIFFTAESNNDSLCYYLEFHKEDRECFGSIAGGSAFKYSLFQRKEDGVWVTGTPTKPQILSEKEAISLGKEIRDALVRGAKIIENSTLDCVENYEKLDKQLDSIVGRYAYMVWVHKYYHMLYPDKFATWHASDWQKYILLSLGIKPSEQYYGRSGQLSMIAQQANISMPVFAHACGECFGNIKHIYRIGTSNQNRKYFQEWHNKGIAAIGWTKIGSLEAYVEEGKINRKLILEQLEKLYYSNDRKMASRKAGEICNFYNTDADSIYVAMDGERLLALGDQIETYLFDETEEMGHCKKIRWNDCFLTEESLPHKSEGKLTSFVEIMDEDNLKFLLYRYYWGAKNNVKKQSIKGDEVEDKRKNFNTRIYPLNQIIYGAPGTGKTYSSAEYALAIIDNRKIDLSKKSTEERAKIMNRYKEYVDKGQIVFTTFHQSYGYEEFVQGLRPVINDGVMNFVVADGIFKKMAERAKKDAENNYILIIDEINRGNISKIFGELITLIEEDKRYREINELKVTLPYGDVFVVPNNLYILGTMNSADKSISLLDTALRRRFDFIEMAPNPEMISDNVLRDVLIRLNAYLKKELRSTDLLIGHSFFIGKDENDLGMIMNHNIIPLLYEYFYEDETKVRRALECLQGTGYIIDNEYGGRIRIKKEQ